jgi:hypothetical protein
LNIFYKKKYQKFSSILEIYNARFWPNSGHSNKNLVGHPLNVCFQPKADIQHAYFLGIKKVTHTAVETY